MSRISERLKPTFLARIDPRQTGPVTLGIDPREAHAGWRDQPLVLVEAQRTGGDAELARKVRDGELLARQRIGLVQMACMIAAAGRMERRLDAIRARGDRTRGHGPET
jgi:hypothetical protein